MYDIHEAANAFPMMTDAEIKDLAEDIKRNGQRVPITLYQGKVLDGRNRLRACQMAGVQPRMVECHIYKDDDDPYMLAWSLNGERRNLTSQEQKAIIWQKLYGMSPKVQRELARIKADGNKARSEAQKRRGDKKKPIKPISDRQKTRAFEAKSAGVNKAAMARAKALLNQSPALADKVARGEIRYSEAYNIVKSKETAIATRKESVKLRCELLDHWIARNSEHLAAWVKILLSVDHRSSQLDINGSTVDLRPGQAERSLLGWSNTFGQNWDRQRVKKFFQFLQDDGLITVDTNNGATVLTVCNWRWYS